MIKKKSLTIKLFYLNALLILLVILLSFLLNNFYLSKYHISKKKTEINKIANSLKSYSVNNEFYDFSDELANRYNLNIILYDQFKNRSSFRMGNMRMMRDFNTSILTEHELENIEAGKIVIKLLKNPMMSINNLIAFVKLKDGNIIVIINSGLVINESTAIAREFYLIIAPITLLISLIASYFFTQRITRPINKLKIIANKMADMDFSERFDLETGDEIEELGKSFNYLSNQLQINISNLNSVADKLKEEISLERELDEKRNEFISNVSHELKTPIALITAYAEGLQDNVPSEEDRQYYHDTILSEGQKMDKLVKELLNYMKLKDKRAEIVYEDVEAIKLIDSVLAKFRLDFSEKNISVDFKHDKLNNLIIKCSNLKFEQILDNLLSNAVNHVESNGRIDISINNSDNKRYKFSIFNSGSGIIENNINKIWDPFFKVDEARDRKYGGIGLGLAIVKEIFDLYNFEYGVVNHTNGVEFFFIVS